MNGSAAISRTVNIFMVYSPLHCLCAEWIVQHFGVGEHNVVFYLKKKFSSFLSPAVWDERVYHPWPRFDPKPGLFGRIRRTRSNLDLVASYCSGAKSIRLHTTVIDTEAINYHINFLRSRFPEANFCVRIFPDGVMNLRRHPQGALREKIKYFRFFRRIVSPELRYYFFKGDRIGSDDSIVDRIYILPGFPHEYNQRKVVELPAFVRKEAKEDRIRVVKRALVIGQPLVVYKRMTKEAVDLVTGAIYQYLMAQGVDEIYYKSHPRDKTREYGRDEYHDLCINEPLELHLAHTPYGIVIGVCSTALLTGRMVLPDWCEVVSCGMNIMSFSDDVSKKFYTNTFKQLNIKMLDVN